MDFTLIAVITIVALVAFSFFVHRSPFCERVTVIRTRRCMIFRKTIRDRRGSSILGCVALRIYKDLITVRDFLFLLFFSFEL